jgi:hypothetical protein
MAHQMGRPGQARRCWPVLLAAEIPVYTRIFRCCSGVFRLHLQSIPIREDHDPEAIHKEAAMFYGLFLRGTPAENLRRDIEIPRLMIDKWLSHPGYDTAFRDSVRRVYDFRRRVLAVFDELVDRQRIGSRAM